MLQKRESEGFGFVLRGAKGRWWMDGWVEKWWVFVGVRKREKRLEQFKTPRCAFHNIYTEATVSMSKILIIVQMHIIVYCG